MATIIVLLVVLSSVFAHEKGHQCAMDRLGYLPGPIRWHWYGMSVRSNVPMRRSADIARVALAGPLAGSAVALCAYATRIDALMVGAWWALAINLCQLIPLEPLDGGHIARALPPEWLALFPAGVFAWLYANNTATTPLGSILMASSGAAVLWRMASWQRYTNNVYLRIEDGELNALRHRWASYAVPATTRLYVCVTYSALLIIGFLILR